MNRYRWIEVDVFLSIYIFIYLFMVYILYMTAESGIPSADLQPSIPPAAGVYIKIDR